LKPSFNALICLLLQQFAYAPFSYIVQERGDVRTEHMGARQRVVEAVCHEVLELAVDPALIPAG
jgi:hypothetical protein